MTLRDSFSTESMLMPDPLATAQSYCQYFYNAPATALRMLHLAAAISGDAGSLGDHLRAVEQQHQKSCDTDVGARMTLWPCGRQQSSKSLLCCCGDMSTRPQLLLCS